MSQELSTIEKPGMLSAQSHQGEYAYEGDASDILIPRLLLGQAISEVVQTQQVANGGIYKNTTKETMGGNGTPMSIIPLSFSKSWVLYEDKDGAFVFKGKEPHTADNANEPWEGVNAEGKKTKRVISMDFYVLIPGEVSDDLEMRKAYLETNELPDLDKALLPCMLSFQSTSRNVGKQLATHFAKAADFDVPAYTNWFQLDSELIKGDKGRYAVFKLSKGGATPKEFRETCEKWRQTVKGSRVKVHEEELEVMDVTPRSESSYDASANEPQEF